VVARDTHLSTLYNTAAATGALPEGLRGVIGGAYGGLVLSGVPAGRAVAPREARRLGINFTRDALARSRYFVVTSSQAAALARLDAAPADRGKIRLVPEDPPGAAGALYEIVTSRSEL
jgi:hypothetical protein